jgi:DNA-binding CsgD family transcriptional regulator
MAVDDGHVGGGKRRATAVVGGFAVATGLLLGAELLMPHDIPIGVLVLVLVTASALVLDPRRALVVLVLAVGSRVAVAAMGDISVSLGVLESAAFAVVTGIGLASRWQRTRRSLSRQGNPTGFIPGARRALQSEAGRLSKREREVLQMALQGLTAAQIGARLYISRRTVETHLEHVYAKLGVQSKRELIALAFDQSSA